MAAYHSTSLWQNSIGRVFDDPEVNAAAERLRTAYERMRTKVAQLTSHVAADFPALTVHDVTHLDALWQTASIIAGDRYPLTPLEGFVLGVSILLHDAALTIEAYEGGIDGLRTTNEWLDAFAAARKAAPSSSDEGGLEAHADFTAIRLLHAKRAGELLDHIWKNSTTGDEIRLLEDDGLRTRIGTVAGAIATSHHWPIEDISTKLPTQLASPTGVPADWRVDPTKIACLLRCADAAHLDDRRAPDLLFALIKRSGLSADHWLFQNWLNPVDIDSSDTTGQTLLFTSTRPFPTAFADAWWIAFDAISLFSKELGSSNALLTSRPQAGTTSPPFEARRVQGISSPHELARYVTTVGWEPRAAELHIGNVRRLISMLGGSQLYGAGPERIFVVLRELIQNARDAIAARRSRDSSFRGRIVVRSATMDDKVRIEIDDDGIGMSERVLTGPLLDFGQSFWTSDLIKEEYPGLVSSGFKSIGKYGIGFFSVFMAAESVSVSSRQFSAGLDDVLTLSFPRGLSLRPIVSRSRPASFGSYSSTVMSLTVDQGVSPIDPYLMEAGGKKLAVALVDYLPIIVLGLDVEVIYEDGAGNQTIVHRAIEQQTPGQQLEWIQSLAPASLADSNARATAANHASRLRIIRQDGQIVGMAALATSLGRLSQLTFTTVEGLAPAINAGFGGYVGYLDLAPANAKRDGGVRLASEATLQKWADEQIQLLGTALTSSKAMMTVVSYNLSMIPASPYGIAHSAFYPRPGKHDIMFLGLDEVLDRIQVEPMAVYVVRNIGIADLYAPRTAYKDMLTFQPIAHGAFAMAIGRPEIPLTSASFFHCLEVRAEERKLSLKKEIVDSMASPPFDMLDVYCYSATKVER